jgi:hypothetical protein
MGNKKIFMGVFLMGLVPVCIFAQHSFELGTGWGNMGVSQETTWRPYDWSTGSRKEVNAEFIYKYIGIGKGRVYYAPSASLFYINMWSMTGALNVGALSLGIGGLGVYMTEPLESYSKEERLRKWVATFEIDFASFSIGGNMTPNYGARGKNSGVREWGEPDDQSLPHPERNGGVWNQYYPFKDTYGGNDGRYIYFQYAIPVTFRVWNMITPKIGFGMFVASNVFIIEKSINFDAPFSIGYDMRAGFSLMLFNGRTP